MPHPLICHPDTPGPPSLRIEAGVRRPSRREMILRYAVFGDIPELRLPPPVQSERADELWRHTCFEAFFRAGAGPEYTELNFSPSRRYATYDFSDYRAGMAQTDWPRTDQIIERATKGRFTLTATITLGDLVFDRVALSAVVEETTGRKSYWALAHPAAKPDFHHADGFVLELPEPS